jgi:hypothetical protein
MNYIPAAFVAAPRVLYQRLQSFPVTCGSSGTTLVLSLILRTSDMTGAYFAIGQSGASAVLNLFGSPDSTNETKYLWYTVLIVPLGSRAIYDAISMVHKSL